MTELRVVSSIDAVKMEVINDDEDDAHVAVNNFIYEDDEVTINNTMIGLHSHSSAGQLRGKVKK